MIAEAKLSRRERNKIRNRREILHAAMQEFAENGYHDTSIQDIAVRAEFAVGTIYALFDTKEELYRQLLIEHAQEAQQEFAHAIQEGDNAYEKLWNYVVAKGRLYEDKIQFARLIFTETLGTGISFKNGPNPELKAMYTMWHHTLAEIFRMGMDEGVFRKGDPMALAVALEGMSNQFLYQWQEDPQGFSYQDALESIRALIFSYLLDEKAGQG